MKCCVANFKLITKLNSDLLEIKKERNHYKFLYREQWKERNKYVQELKHLNTCILNLKTENEILRSKLNDLPDINRVQRRKHKRKAWCKLTCEKSKRQRICEYGKSVFSTLRNHVPHCKRAHLSLCLSSQSVNFHWKGPQLQRKYETNGNKHMINFGSKDDHLYAKIPSIDHDNNTDLIDVDYAKIFDSEGNWQKMHKRRIIHVLDTFRISHEAYHELRHAGQNHFPPLHRIIKEKTIMSGEIPYIKHSTVSLKCTKNLKCKFE